jgi:diadenosine tetraphosphate (Ap4A) HIT family hydrolase
MYPRKPFTSAEKANYHQRSQMGPCFICKIIQGNPDYPHHLIYEDENAIVFLNRYPTLYGYTLVAPRQHREQAISDFTHEEYLQFQSLIYRVSIAIQRVVPTERLYLLSLGSQQGNRHVHWHLAPLPPKVPYLEQQLEALSNSHGILDIPDDDMADLAHKISLEIDKG